MEPPVACLAVQSIRALSRLQNLHHKALTLLQSSQKKVHTHNGCTPVQQFSGHNTRLDPSPQTLPAGGLGRGDVGQIRGMCETSSQKVCAGMASEPSLQKETETSSANPSLTRTSAQRSSFAYPLLPSTSSLTPSGLARAYLPASTSTSHTRSYSHGLRHMSSAAPSPGDGGSVKSPDEEKHASDHPHMRGGKGESNHAPPGEGRGGLAAAKLEEGSLVEQEQARGDSGQVHTEPPGPGPGGLERTLSEPLESARASDQGLREEDRVLIRERVARRGSARGDVSEPDPGSGPGSGIGSSTSRYPTAAQSAQWRAQAELRERTESAGRAERAERAGSYVGVESVDGADSASSTGEEGLEAGREALEALGFSPLSAAHFLRQGGKRSSSISSSLTAAADSSLPSLSATAVPTETLEPSYVYEPERLTGGGGRGPFDLDNEWGSVSSPDGALSKSEAKRRAAEAAFEEQMRAAGLERAGTTQDKLNAKALIDMLAGGGAFDAPVAAAGQEEGGGEAPSDVPLALQRSLRVGIIGAPNAGKSVLTNLLVGAKVSAVSRKTNTTRIETLGVRTRGATQLLFYDTPGLTHEIAARPLKRETRRSVSRAWHVAEECEALLVLVDAERQIRQPDPRVWRLLERLGAERLAGQQRLVCLNKVDLVRDKQQLLPLAQRIQALHAFDRVFMISGLKNRGIRLVEDFLHSLAVTRPWEQDPRHVTTQSGATMALEIVRERFFERLHKELPYTTEQRHMAWTELDEGAVRIEQQLLVSTPSQRAIAVGHNGNTIRQIGTEARLELEKLFGRKVHLFIEVKVKHGHRNRA